METEPEVPAETAENPALAADAEQHALQEIAGLRERVAAGAASYAWPTATAAGAVLAAWLVYRWRRKKPS
jgi:hypothetical protein